MTQWAFVTGGGGDIGGAVCHALAKEGWSIICVDRVAERAEAVARAVSSIGSRRGRPAKGRAGGSIPARGRAQPVSHQPSAATPRPATTATTTSTG